MDSSYPCMSTLDPASSYPASPAEVRDNITAMVSEYSKEEIYHLASLQNLVLVGLGIDDQALARAAQLRHAGISELLKTFIDDIPDATLLDLPTTRSRHIHCDTNFRLVVRVLREETWSLHIQVDRQPKSLLVAGASKQGLVGPVEVYWEYPMTPAEIREALKRDLFFEREYVKELDSTPGHW